MIRRLLVAAALATVAGAAAILGLSAALDVRWDPEMAVAQAVAAVFLGQYLLVAHLLTRRTPMAELLTTTQVADLTGQPAAAVPDWAASRRIRPTTTPDGQTLYPAALVRFTHARDTRIARNIAAAQRLRRFIRNALIA